MGIKVGYARCSKDEQDTTAQRNGLLALGVAEEHIYVDHGLTGTNRQRPGLALAMTATRQGDTLVVTKLDRLARSVRDAHDIADELERKGVALSFNGSVYDPRDPMGKMAFSMLAVIGEFERDLISMRTKEALAVPRVRAKMKGRAPKLSSSQRKHLLELHEAGEHSQVEIAELLGVSRTTIYRELQRESKKRSAESA